MRKLLIALTGLLLLAPAALTAQETTTVIVVRHAEKAVEPAGDPALTEAGTARARALDEMLATRPVQAVIVSEYARTRLTAEPVLQRAGLTPEVASVRAGMREHVMSIVEMVRTRHAGKTVLVVGHSNTVPLIVQALTGAEVEPICDGQHSNVYVVTLRGTERPVMERRTYGAPDPADACAP